MKAVMSECDKASANVMNCAEFKKNFDLYVDDELVVTVRDAAAMHIASCPACEEAVTRFQQNRCMLTTAVAELAAAVDVSGMWERVEAALGTPVAVAVEPVPSRPPAFANPAAGDMADAASSSLGRRLAAAFGLRPLGYVWRLGTAASLSAVAAAMLFLLFAAPGVEVADNSASRLQGSWGALSRLAANSDLPVSGSSRFSSRFSHGTGSHVKRVASRRVKAGGFSDFGVPVSLSLPSKFSTALGAQAVSQAVRVDAIEAGPGSSVSTWELPRSGGRVIWVSSTARTAASAEAFGR